MGVTAAVEEDAPSTHSVLKQIIILCECVRSPKPIALQQPRVPVVLQDPSREKKHYISSWHMFLPSDVTHGLMYMTYVHA